MFCGADCTGNEVEQCVECFNACNYCGQQHPKHDDSCVWKDDPDNLNAYL